MVTRAANLTCQPACAALVGLELRLNEVPDVDVAPSAFHSYFSLNSAKVALNSLSFFIHFIHLHFLSIPNLKMFNFAQNKRNHVIPSHHSNDQEKIRARLQ